MTAKTKKALATSIVETVLLYADSLGQFEGKIGERRVTLQDIVGTYSPYQTTYSV